MNTSYNILKVIYLANFILLSNNVLQAQESSSNTAVHNPPVIVEAFASDRGVMAQMIIDKQFNSLPKFGVFSVAYIVAEWGQKEVDDQMYQASLTYEIFKGLRLNAGFHYDSGNGMKPNVGLIYTYANEKWLFIANPRIEPVKDTNFETLVLVEFKPKINEKLRFYSRIQALYEQNIKDDFHARSYVMARAGISYKEFTIGLASNIDFYGPTKHNINSYGGFVSFQLF